MDLTATTYSSPASVTMPSTSLRPMFLYDTDHPVTLEASVVSASTSHTTYIVTCPSSCEPSEFPEQTITHVGGSSWAGERTWDGTTTRWGCRLGNGGRDTLTDQNGWCSTASATDGEDIKFPKETAVNSCFVTSHSVPVYVTAGMEKIYKYHGYYDPEVDAKGLISGYSSLLSSMGCPAATTTKESPKPTGEAKEKDESETARETGSAAETKTTGESDEDSTAAATPTETANNSYKMSVNKLAIMGSLLLGAWACA